jgi:CubicO group peptidase (beta-lactamase class C family)
LCRAGQTTDVFRPDRQARIERAVSKFMATSNAPGVSVAVVQDGEFVWSGGFGMADLENSVPATADTLYRLGSISKPITATAALVLSERGQLDLDAPIQKYCPAFPQKPWPITTRQLLGHLGGIRYYRVPETPYSVSQTDPEVGNTRHFEDGIDGGLKFLRERSVGGAAGNTLQLLHARLHAGRMRDRRRFWTKVRGLRARERSDSGGHAPDASG